MTTEIWRAVFETPSFRFESYGVSQAHALKVLKKGWREHAKQTEADPYYLKMYEEDIWYDKVRIGQCMRDEQVIFEQE
jgi:hypothetical protein